MIGDGFEGVLLETIKVESSTKPCVRPLEYFERDIRVEFPRHLREDNPIGTRFRADVKVFQKTKDGQPFEILTLLQLTVVFKNRRFRHLRVVANR